MCYAVQVPELNSNDCAQAERAAFFQQNCGSLGMTPDPVIAREKILNVDGNSVDCMLTERGVGIRHFTGTNLLVMEHTSTRAIINHVGVDGQISLRLSLRDLNSNLEVARVQKTWQDEAEPLTVTGPASMGSPVLTCLVSLAQDPDRE